MAIAHLTLVALLLLYTSSGVWPKKTGEAQVPLHSTLHQPECWRYVQTGDLHLQSCVHWNILGTSHFLSLHPYTVLPFWCIVVVCFQWCRQTSPFRCHDETPFLIHWAVNDTNMLGQPAPLIRMTNEIWKGKWQSVHTTITWRTCNRGAKVWWMQRDKHSEWII